MPGAVTFRLWRRESQVRRLIVFLVAGAFVVRSRNPDEDGADFRSGRTVRRYRPERTWLQFMWFGVRDGLTEVVKE